jgi:hypothetical protein
MKTMHLAALLLPAIVLIACDSEQRKAQRAAEARYVDSLAQVRTDSIINATQATAMAAALAARASLYNPAATKAWDDSNAVLLSRLRTDVDKFEDVTWYYSKSTPNYVDNKALYLYVGQRKNERPWIRMRVRYSGDNWIFSELAEVSNDGVKEVLVGPGGDWKHDNASGAVWEWVDVVPTGDQLLTLRRTAAAKSSTVRFTGDKYHADYVVSDKVKAGLLDILALYKGHGGEAIE